VLKDFGVRGGVGGTSSESGTVGERYVIPTALWRPVMSAFWKKQAIVTSPAVPPETSAGIVIRWMVDGLRSCHLGSVTTFSGSKYFQRRMTFAAPGSARIIVFPPLAGSCVRVSLLQWSLLL
jgi:hypothetical protein